MIGDGFLGCDSLALEKSIILVLQGTRNMQEEGIRYDNVKMAKARILQCGSHVLSKICRKRDYART